MELGEAKTQFQTQSPEPTLFSLLIATRLAQCHDDRDKVYGLLGVCGDYDRAAIQVSYKPECTAVSQYQAATAHYLGKYSLALNDVLACVDHEPSPDLPSWVPTGEGPDRPSRLDRLVC